MALGVDEFTELVASTLRKIEPELYDNVTTRHPTLDLIKAEEESATGRALVVNLELAENTSTQWTDDSGTFSTAVSGEIIGAAEFDWSDPLVSSVRLRWKQLKMNSGPQQVIDLLKSHIRSMEKAHAKKIVEALHARADLGEVDAAQFHSLDELTGDSTYDADPNGDGTLTDAFTVGGIDSSVQTLWQAQRIEHPADGSYSIRKAFRDVRDEVYVQTDSNNETDYVIAGRDIFAEFEDSFDDKVRYTEFGDGQTAFTEIKFGDLNVRLDPDCPAKRAYFLDRGTVQLKSLAGAFMEPQDAQKIQGTLDRVHPVASVLAVGVNERRANAVLLRPDTAGGDA